MFADHSVQDKRQAGELQVAGVGPDNPHGAVQESTPLSLGAVEPGANVEPSGYSQVRDIRLRSRVAFRLVLGLLFTARGNSYNCTEVDKGSSRYENFLQEKLVHVFCASSGLIILEVSLLSYQDSYDTWERKMPYLYLKV